MTVWMHKGGDIILRYKRKLLPGNIWPVENGWGYIDAQSDYFFKAHCVYIGRF